MVLVMVRWINHKHSHFPCCCSYFLPSLEWKFPFLSFTSPKFTPLFLLLIYKFLDSKDCNLVKFTAPSCSTYKVLNKCFIIKKVRDRRLFLILKEFKILWFSSDRHTLDVKQTFFQSGVTGLYLSIIHSCHI